MTRITAKKGTVKTAGGWEAYLRKEFGLLDEVEMTGVEDDGLHGSCFFIFDTPQGEVKCSGYISIPPVATYKMSVLDEGDRKALFGFEEYNKLKVLQAEAENGF